MSHEGILLANSNSTDLATEESRTQVQAIGRGTQGREGNSPFGNVPWPVLDYILQHIHVDCHADDWNILRSVNNALCDIHYFVVGLTTIQTKRVLEAERRWRRIRGGQKRWANAGFFEEVFCKAGIKLTSGYTTKCPHTQLTFYHSAPLCASYHNVEYVLTGETFVELERALSFFRRGKLRMAILSIVWELLSCN